VCVCVCASISFPYSTRDGLNRFPGGLRDVDVLEKKLRASLNPPFLFVLVYLFNCLCVYLFNCLCVYLFNCLLLPGCALL